MELHADQVVARDRRDHAAAVVGQRRDMHAFVGHEVIGMEEIGLARLDQRGAVLVAHRRDVVPAHVRDLDRGIGHLDRADLAGDPVEPWGLAMLQPPRGEELHAHADAQERRAADLDPLGHRFDQMGNRAQPFGAGLEAADAGQDDTVGGADHVGVGGDRDVLGTGCSQGVGHRLQIARAVVDESRDLSHQAHPSSRGPPRPCAGPAPPHRASRGRSP